MAKGSAIEWTDNAVPVVTGCAYKGPGCKHCYAVPLAWRLAHNPHPAVAARYAGTVEKRPDGTLAWTGRINVNLDQLDAGRRLAVIDGTLCALKLPFRMLGNDELARAMSFPVGYRFSGTPVEVTKQIGNAVPVLTAEAHIDALFED